METPTPGTRRRRAAIALAALVAIGAVAAGLVSWLGAMQHSSIEPADLATSALGTITVVATGEVTEIESAGILTWGAKVATFVPEGVAYQESESWNVGAQTPIAPLVAGEEILVGIDADWKLQPGDAVTLGISQPYTTTSAPIDGTAGHVEAVLLDGRVPAGVTDGAAAVVDLISTAAQLRSDVSPTDVLLTLVTDAESFLDTLNTATGDDAVPLSGLLAEAVEALRAADES